ncbi:MAG: hypothetical protein J0L73_03960 [Verrucomicrobia bacterium]|nr:hypothetical protein [Verrucomicrobiota bacterium]
MSAPPLSSRRTICLVALGLCLGGVTIWADDQDPGERVPSVIQADQSPADFLDSIGQRTKARWRLQFRPPPPTPPTDRGRAALILGGLMADSFLIWQAGDSQQFRNNNQEVLSYCRMLGLGEKLLPHLMAQGKMAESNEWKELRSEIVDSHQVLIRMLREQRDDDLAVLTDLGLWLRLLDIVCTSVVENGSVEARPLCIGSPAVLQAVRDDFNRLGLPKHEEPMIKHIGAAIEEISALWRSLTPPTAEQVTKTHEKLKEIMQMMVEKQP